MNPDWPRLQDEADELRSLQISTEPVAWRDAVLDLHRRLRALETEPVDAPPAPAPAAEGDLWQVMLEAHRLGMGAQSQYGIHRFDMRGMAAEIAALRDWLKRELCIGAGDPEPAFGTAAWHRWRERQSLLARLTHEAAIAQRAAEGSDG